MKKILCPTDFSQSAVNAMKYAGAFAAHNGASLTLYHIQPEPVTDTVHSDPLISETADKATFVASDKLDNYCEMLENEFKISVDYSVDEAVSTDSTTVETGSDTPATGWDYSPAPERVQAARAMNPRADQCAPKSPLPKVTSSHMQRRAWGERGLSCAPTGGNRRHAPCAGPKPRGETAP